MGKLNTISPKHEIVYRDILSGIMDGHLTPGQRLPAESEMVNRYGLSLGSVRRALSTLHKQGMIEKRQGSGSYVTLGLNKPTASPNLMIWVRSHCAIDRVDLSPHWLSPLRDGLAHGALMHQVHNFYESPTVLRRSTLPQVPRVQLAGVVVVAVGGSEALDLFEGVPEAVPKVMINCQSSDTRIPSIDIDQEGGAFQAALNLLRIGHRRILFAITCASNLHAPVYECRARGYARAYATLGLTIDDAYLYRELMRDEAEKTLWPRRFREVVRQLKPTAIVMDNLGRVLHAIDILQGEGLHIPEDISLVVFDDDPGLQKTQPAITCVRQPLELMGRMAIETLIDQASAESMPKPHRRLLPEIILRDSIAAPCGL